MEDAAHVNVRSQPGLVQAVANASRLLLALANTALRHDLLVASALTLSFAALCALAPLLFKQAVDSLGAGAPAVAPSLPFWLIGAYLAAVCLLRVLADVRMHVIGMAEKRLQRCVTARTVVHMLNLPTRFLADSCDPQFESGASGAVDWVHARAREYSWCNPPSIGLVHTAPKLPSWCRDFGKGKTIF